MKRFNKTAEVDIKGILIGLIFIIFISGLVLIMVNDFTSQYGVDASEASALLNAMGANSSEYEELVGDYNATLFKDRESSTFDWIDFMWKAAWSVMKSTATLPGNVINVLSVGMIQIGAPVTVQAVVFRFVLTMIMLIITFWVITKMPGMFK